MICVECCSHIDQVYKEYSKGNIRLTQCSHCNAFVDPYVEYELILLLIDVCLHRVQVFRHLLFNITQTTLTTTLNILIPVFICLSTYLYYQRYTQSSVAIGSIDSIYSIYTTEISRLVMKPFLIPHPVVLSIIYLPGIICAQFTMYWVILVVLIHTSAISKQRQRSTGQETEQKANTSAQPAGVEQNTLADQPLSVCLFYCCLLSCCSVFLLVLFYVWQYDVLFTYAIDGLFISTQIICLSTLYQSSVVITATKVLMAALCSRMSVVALSSYLLGEESVVQNLQIS